MAIGSYTFQTVVYPGASGTWLSGINNAGEVSGYYTVGYPGYPYPRSFTETNGTITNLGDDRGIAQATGAVNNVGQVAGTTGDAISGVDGFLWTNGATQLIINGPTFGQLTKAFGVNDAGVVVGSHGSTAAKVQPVAFTWQNGAMSFFSVPGASATEAHGINNAGVIVGTADNYGFIDFGGQVSLMGIAGAATVDPMAINNNDVVAGSYYDGAHWHGWIDSAGQMQFIDAPGAADTWVTGINDANTITGYSDSASFGPTQGFIATDPPPADPVTTMVREDYVAAFDRDADPGGQAFWTNLLKTTPMTARDLAWVLTTCPEGQLLHGGQSDVQFVNNLYANALGREADQGGLSFWTGMLQAGAGRADVLSAIAQSSEGQQHFSAAHA